MRGPRWRWLSFILVATQACSFMFVRTPRRVPDPQCTRVPLAPAMDGILGFAAAVPTVFVAGIALSCPSHTSDLGCDPGGEAAAVLLGAAVTSLFFYSSDRGFQATAQCREQNGGY